MFTSDLAETARAEGVERLVVGLVVHDADRVLIVSRSLDDDFLPGVDEIPSGGVNPGETLEAALWREVNEEVGQPPLRITPGFFHVFDYMSASGRLTRQLTIAAAWAGREVSLSAEHSSSRWVNSEEAKHCSSTPEMLSLLRAWFSWRSKAGPRQQGESDRT